MEFEYGYIGLFAVCFLSATLLMIPSEAFVVGMILAGFPWLGVLFIASIANWMGSLTNYLIGRFFDIDKIERWLKLNPEKVDRLQLKVEKYGIWTSLLTWIPFIGDPLTIVMGMFKLNFIKVATLILLVKTLRYAVLIWLSLQF